MKDVGRYMREREGSRNERENEMNIVAVLRLTRIAVDVSPTHLLRISLL